MSTKNDSAKRTNMERCKSAVTWSQTRWYQWGYQMMSSRECRSVAESVIRNSHNRSYMIGSNILKQLRVRRPAWSLILYWLSALAGSTDGLLSSRLTYLHSTKLCKKFKIFRQKFGTKVTSGIFKYFPKFEGHTSPGRHTNKTLNLLTKLWSFLFHHLFTLRYCEVLTPSKQRHLR
jgi:hypothetical protein